MGIPLFASWLRKNYPEIFKKSINLSFDLLCLDYNAMIYPCVHEILETYEDKEDHFDKDIFEEKVICSVIEHTKKLISIVNPQKTLIAVDGVCPRAKMIQQRYRRYMSIYTKTNENKKILWDTNAITPGTLFMAKLNKKLAVSFDDSVIISDSSQVGEGEHKIIKFVSTLNNKNIMIVGLDADLLILALSVSVENKIVIRRETNNEVQYVLGHMLLEKLIQEIPNFNEQNIGDLVLLFSFLGNDFVPEIKAFNEHQNIRCSSILNTYKTYRKKYSKYYLVKKVKEDYQIQWVSLFYFLQLLNFHENISSEQMNETYDYYKISNKKELCKEYCKSLSWIVNYYINDKKCPSWEWYYPYKISPYIKDLVCFLKENKQFIFEWYKDKPLKPTEQLLLVFPPQSLDLIPNTYLVNVVKSVLKHSYPHKIELDPFESDKPSWHQRPFLPEMDFSYIKELNQIFE